MEKRLMSDSQHVLLTGANTLGLVTLLAYTVKNLNEKTQEIEELRTEFSNLRKYIGDHNTRTNMTFNTLSKKIEESKKTNQKNMNFLQDIKNNLSTDTESLNHRIEQEQDKIEEIDVPRVDDITEALKILTSKN
jgi:chromosome segregation ATPase